MLINKIRNIKNKLINISGFYYCNKWKLCSDSYGQSRATAGGWLRGAAWRGATDIFKMLSRAGRVIVAGETRTPGPEMKVAP